MGRQDVHLDPAVAAILGEQEFKQRAREADTPAEKRQVRKEKERRESRQRVTLELHPQVVAVLRKVAEVEGCSPAAACNYLLGRALLEYGSGAWPLDEVKATTDSNRWQYVVDVGELLGPLGWLLGRL